jgi:hypothetical protein
VDSPLTEPSEPSPKFPISMASRKLFMLSGVD